MVDIGINWDAFPAFADAGALEAAADGDVHGSDALMLVGDPEYYGTRFGFSAERTGGWTLPGPYEQHRLLALAR